MRIAFNTFKTYNNNPYQVNQQQKNNQTIAFKEYKEPKEERDPWGNEFYDQGTIMNRMLTDTIDNPDIEYVPNSERWRNIGEALCDMVGIKPKAEKVPESYFTQEELKKAHEEWYEACGGIENMPHKEPERPKGVTKPYDTYTEDSEDWDDPLSPY